MLIRSEQRLIENKQQLLKLLSQQKIKRHRSEKLHLIKPMLRRTGLKMRKMLQGKSLKMNKPRRQNLEQTPSLFRMQRRTENETELQQRGK